MDGSVDPEDRLPPVSGREAITETSPNSSAAAAAPALAETELESALQLLVERAQYITGATGTALALPQGGEMVCRASAGSSAPPVGARLQVRSGLTGESISRRQMLRCNNAETDPRVNLEACRALGIASIVVLPLLGPNGAIRGLFELFSDHPYAFEERDLIALERMADLTLTALDLAERRPNSLPAPRREPEKPVGSPTANGAPQAAAIELKPEPAVLPVELPANRESVADSVPEAMLRVQRCVSCGFPVSEGRTLCLDCEKLDSEKTDSERQDFENKPRAQGGIEKQEIKPNEQQETSSDPASDSSTPIPEEIAPAFLVNSPPPQKSWLANPVNLLAIVVLILMVLVAIVVFR
jgi:putative methionine-R-sulfoxide reductase with GAF domain